jgi:hypothetical protein
VLKRGEGVCDIAPISAAQPPPVDQVRPTSAAFAALVGHHLLQLLEAVQIVVAVVDVHLMSSRGGFRN